MKIRIKFQKTGMLRFIGHLDVMRTFQKLNRRAGIDIAYSGGYSPHQQMSFATPLGLGLTSTSEYVDMELNSAPSKDELIRQLNAVNTEDMKVLDACLLPDDAKNAMSLLAAADYTLSFRDEKTQDEADAFFDAFFAFYDRPSVIVTKKTKTSAKEVDLKQQIREMERRGNDLFLKVDAGSVSNCRPDLILDTFFEGTGREKEPYLFMTNRDELYGEEDGSLIPLIAYGKDF